MIVDSQISTMDQLGEILTTTVVGGETPEEIITEKLTFTAKKTLQSQFDGMMSRLS